VTSYATQRIQTISQRVMTRANLMNIVEKYGLYEDERKRETTEEILERMRDDIELEMISAEVIDPRTGRPMPATIAFSLSFSGEDPPSASCRTWTTSSASSKTAATISKASSTSSTPTARIPT